MPVDPVAPLDPVNPELPASQGIFTLSEGITDMWHLSNSIEYGQLKPHEWQMAPELVSEFP